MEENAIRKLKLKPKTTSIYISAMRTAEIARLLGNKAWRDVFLAYQPGESDETQQVLQDLSKTANPELMRLI